MSALHEHTSFDPSWLVPKEHRSFFRTGKKMGEGLYKACSLLSKPTGK